MGLTIEKGDQRANCLPGFARKQAQQNPEAGEDLPQVVPSSAEDDILHVSDHTLEKVSPQEPVGLHVAQSTLDVGSAPHVLLRRTNLRGERHAKASQFERARKVLRSLKTMAGRVQRDVERKLTDEGYARNRGG